MSAIAMSERAQTAITLGESHFREFKSGLEGAPGNKSKRPNKEIATNIAQTLVAFANADGGELLVGVEDNGEITGLNDFLDEDLKYLEESPRIRIHKDTPLASVKIARVNIDGKIILYFSVPKSVKYVHLTSDGRCLQRRDLESVPIASEKIIFHRQEELSRHFDRDFIEGPQADALSLDLVNAVSDQILKGMSPEKCLQYLEIGEYSFSGLKLRRAALLLFAKDPNRWHPRLQVRIIKVDGTDLKTGEAYNVITDQIVTGNILTLVDKSWESLRPHLVQTKLEKTAKFEQKSIYPELACREALLNAIAHRDYAQEGRGIEVYVFSDRLEIKSPGALLSTINLEDIILQKGAHQSRNTYIARVLRELGYMRELGEGMRRIYDLMQTNELSPPELRSNSDTFSIVLNNKPIYSDKDQLWLDQFDITDLDREKKSIILLGQEGRVFSAQEIWDVVGIVDTEHYRRLVDSLQKYGILTPSVDRDTAKKIARKKKIPYREFPRYQIQIPGQTLSKPPSKTLKSHSIIIESEELRDDRKRIWVGNLNTDTTRDNLFDEFAKLGDIEEIFIPMDGNKNKGYAFIEFSENKSVSAAIDLDKQLTINGRSLTIRNANRRG
ncbi:putative DNA binding domain-containing protein [Trichlorobacter lovleyi]|uniref:ATP-binding protein n=1 Tax=Trichlorobacter lovleyi TaxID=313985 RepID=UPI00223F8981|nr:ATP-binding protein [Trichlorobacter lovleyi]QOX79674.1 putative DNA binding domain-containing protein [Trichlorobacter lovleyi]